VTWIVLRLYANVLHAGLAYVVQGGKMKCYGEYGVHELPFTYFIFYREIATSPLLNTNMWE
jgi:hypothetical protein